MLEYEIKLSLIFLNWGEVFLGPGHALKVIFSVSGPFMIRLVPRTKKIVEALSVVVYCIGNVMRSVFWAPKPKVS